MTDGKRQFRLANFEGPLDLLLFLLRKNEVSIYDIPIAQITAQYLDFINAETLPDINETSDFYLMAATLIHLKSKVLLPIEIDLDNELEDPREELVERLIEYQKYKKLTALMKQPELGWIIEREKTERSLPFAGNEMGWQKIDARELLNIFSGLMSDLVPETIIDLYEEVSINEKLTFIREKIQSRKEFSFTDIITRPGSIMDIICAFLALLELVKTKLISIYQNKIFGEIIVRARNIEVEENAIAE